MTHRVYLSGPIAGNSFESASDWREQITDELEDNYDIEVLDPMRDKYADPETIVVSPTSVSAIDETLLTDRGVVVRDHIDTIRADALFVNFLGASDKSLGTMSEIAWAWDRQIPIVLIMEPSGNPNDHAFVRAMASYRVDTIERGLNVLKSVLGIRSNWSLG